MFCVRLVVNYYCYGGEFISCYFIFPLPFFMVSTGLLIVWHRGRMVISVSWLSWQDRTLLSNHPCQQNQDNSSLNILTSGHPYWFTLYSCSYLLSHWTFRSILLPWCKFKIEAHVAASTLAIICFNAFRWCVQLYMWIHLKIQPYPTEPILSLYLPKRKILYWTSLSMSVF
jgi:hypothetical protein